MRASLLLVGQLFVDDALELIERHGARWFYGGALGREISAVVQSPPKDPATTYPVPAGLLG